MQITFWTGRADALGDAQRLLQRWVQAGLRVRVHATPAGLRVLDRHLWVADPGSFLAHRRTLAAQQDANDAPPGIGRTPIWLGNGAVCGAPPRVALGLWFAAGNPEGGEGADADAALVDAVPPWPEAVERVVELVGVDPASIAQGRRRWSAYRRLGLEPQHHGAGEGAAAG